MTVQALGQVTNPYLQVQASTVFNAGSQDGAVQDTILTGCAPLASAIEPGQKMATSQVKMVPPTKPGAETGSVKMATYPPAPQGCGNQLDCAA